MSTDYKKEQVEAQRQMKERLRKRAEERAVEIADELADEIAKTQQTREKVKENEENYEEMIREKRKKSNKEYVPDTVLQQFAGFFLFLGVLSFFFIPFLGVPSLLISGVLYLMDYNKKKNIVGQLKEKSVSAIDEIKEMKPTFGTSQKTSTVETSHKKEEPNPDELLKWHELMEKGVITEEEFEEHKQRILK